MAVINRTPLLMQVCISIHCKISGIKALIDLWHLQKRHKLFQRPIRVNQNLGISLNSLVKLLVGCGSIADVDFMRDDETRLCDSGWFHNVSLGSYHLSSGSYK
jgi:hypothetical protein